MTEQITWRPTMEECREVLEELVRVNTCQPQGNEGVLADTIIGMLPENAEYKKIEHTKERASLVVKLKGEASQGGIAFIGHMDTVACNDMDQWSFPPHQAVVKEGVLYGRGSADMKGGDASMLLAMKQISKGGFHLKKPVYFCFTADEESKGIGIRAIAEGNYLKGVEEVVICEPSGETIGTCEKGALWLEVIVSGKAAHASRPALGVNAVEYAIEFSKRLKEIMKEGPKHPVLGTSTVSITNFHGGIMTNIIPSGAEMELDIRTVPGISHDDIIRRAGEVSRKMMEEHPFVKLEINILNNRPALETKEDSPLVEHMMNAARASGISTKIKGLHFYTDASQLIPEMAVPFVIAGPGDDAMAHCVNEHIELESVARYTQLYSSYIRDYYT